MAGMRFAYRFAMIYGLVIGVVMFFAASSIAGWFTDNPTAVATSNMHLTLVPWTYGFLGMSMISVSAFNAYWYSKDKYSQGKKDHKRKNKELLIIFFVLRPLLFFK